MSMLISRRRLPRKSLDNLLRQPLGRWMPGHRKPQQLTPLMVLLGRPLLRRRCQDPARPDPLKTNRNRMRHAVRPRAENPEPSPAPGSLRRSSHFGSRSAPSRAALLAWLKAASSWAFPLDCALCRLPSRERRGAMLRDRSTLLTAHFNCVWIRQRSFAI